MWLRDRLLIVGLNFSARLPLLIMKYVDKYVKAAILQNSFHLYIYRWAEEWSREKYLKLKYSHFILYFVFLILYSKKVYILNTLFSKIFLFCFCSWKLYIYMHQLEKWWWNWHTTAKFPTNTKKKKKSE